MDVSGAVLTPPPYGPPGVLLPGLVTVTVTLPGAARAEAGTAAMSCIAERNMVRCGTPFQFTIALRLKLLPLTVTVRLAAPAFALSGIMADMTGTMPACVI